MTYLGSIYIDMCIWITVGTRAAKNRGQEVDHLAKIHDF